MLINFSGLPAVGKTTISRLLAEEIGAVFLRVDTIEKVLQNTGVEPIEGKGYQITCAVATENLKLGRTVIADQVNNWELTRSWFHEAAKEAGAKYLDLEVICSDRELHRARLEARGCHLTWDDILAREADTHPWSCERLVIDSAKLSPEEAVSEIRREMDKMCQP
ncbi:MAG: ATP-binding protein [Armatimonadetes bacterium]|nr:ATP-binding protein [Armatimonadota bacterium]